MIFLGKILAKKLLTIFGSGNRIKLLLLDIAIAWTLVSEFLILYEIGSVINCLTNIAKIDYKFNPISLQGLPVL